MLSVNDRRVKVASGGSHVRIDTSPSPLPIEVTVTGKLPPGAGTFFVQNAMEHQTKSPEYKDEYNEPSAIIGKTRLPVRFSRRRLRWQFRRCSPKIRTLVIKRWNSSSTIWRES